MLVGCAVGGCWLGGVLYRRVLVECAEGGLGCWLGVL